MPRIVLCMIVKDEAHVIERCLTAVRPYVDAWLLVDTGSSDGTPDIARRALAGLPGELVERPWVDFGHNRSEALELARGLGGWSLVIDADEVFHAPAGFTWPSLTGDAAYVEHQHGDIRYQLVRLFSSSAPWRYAGVLHEYPDLPGGPARLGRVPGPCVVGHYDGGRSVGLSTVAKYTRDAETLERALRDDPGNTRYQYYLARSYRDSQQAGKASAAFRRRVEMGGGFDEEVYDSLHQIGQLYEALGASDDTVVGAYLAAFEQRPARAEPLCSLARYFRERRRWPLALMFAARSMGIDRPDDLLFVDESVYGWRSQDEYSIAAYWTGDCAESARVCRALLDSDDLPADQRARVEENLRFARSGAARRPEPDRTSGASTRPAPARV